MVKKISVFIFLGLLITSCSFRKENKLSENQKKQIKLIYSYFEDEVYSEESIYFCPEFDFFSINRFLDVEAAKVYFENKKTKKINREFLNKKIEFVDLLNNEGPKSILLSISGFDSGLFIITVSKVERNNYTNSACDVTLNNETTYLVSIANEEVKVLLQEEVFYN